MSDKSKQRGLTDRQEKAIEVLMEEDLLFDLLNALSVSTEPGKEPQSGKQENSSEDSLPPELEDLSQQLPGYSREELEKIADCF